MTPDALRELLSDDPKTFSVFQSIRLLELHRTDGDKRVGQFESPSAEAVRFTGNARAVAATAEVEDITFDDEGSPSIEQNEMLLVGWGPLPTQYSQQVRREGRRDERPLTDFLDMFHHRLVSLWYRAWASARDFVGFEQRVATEKKPRGEREPRDFVTRRLDDLLGIASDRMRKGLGVPHEVLLEQLGPLGLTRRSGRALEGLLNHYFEVPIQVEEFVGAWYSLGERSLYHVDDDYEEGALAGGGLGFTTVVGDEVWDAQARVRLHVGPLGREQFRRFLPGGPGHAELRALTRFFADDQLDFEVRLILEKDEVPGLQLGETLEVRLARDTWIRTRPRAEHADAVMILRDED